MGAHPRYVVTIRVAAGSFLTATAVAAVVVMGSAPASAAAAALPSVQGPARALDTAPLFRRGAEDTERQSWQGIPESTGGGANGPGGRSSGGGASAEAGKLLGAESASRLDGVRREMEQAVQMKMVTADQAERFVNQLQERILRGL